jgi:hypothetical protein
VSEALTAAPVFAVVGHPNKGKSSLVATLARDDRVRIAPEPGTTTRAVRYPLELDGETLYVLVDTPGFQRARAALAWMRAQAEREGANAAARPSIVARFCVEPANTERFPDEVELLRPIVDGAGILYVVDGAVPYAGEYEAEMEILRWTGRPSLAIINPIGEPRHAEAWRAALGQYFRVVRLLDAVRADHARQLDLLRTFAELDEGWREPIGRAVSALEAEREHRRTRAAREIADMLVAARGLRVEQRIPHGEDAASERAALEERYRSELRRLERRCRRAVEAIYAFHQLEVSESAQAERDTERALLDEDLFSQHAWLVFGLRKRDLAATGALAGAGSGGAIDAALGGSSLLAGALIGGAVGGVLGWLGGDRLARAELLQQPIGGTLARVGPSKGTNLVVVLLGRARLHHALVSRRTHARRDLHVELPGAAGGDDAPGLKASAARRVLTSLRSADESRDALESAVAALLDEPA